MLTITGNDSDDRFLTRLTGGYFFLMTTTIMTMRCSRRLQAQAVHKLPARCRLHATESRQLTPLSCGLDPGQRREVAVRPATWWVLHAAMSAHDGGTVYEFDFQLFTNLGIVKGKFQ